MGEGRGCIIFTALTEHHVDKSPIVFVFPASLPLCFIPRFSPFSHSLCSLLSSHNVCYIHIQHLTSLRVSPSLSLFLLGIKSYHHFPALFLSFSPSLSPVMASSNPLSLSDNSVVLLWGGPNFRTAIPFWLCPSHLAFFFFLSLPQCCSGYRDVATVKREHPSMVPLGAYISSLFFFSTLCFLVSVTVAPLPFPLFPFSCEEVRLLLTQPQPTHPLPTSTQPEHQSTITSFHLQGQKVTNYIDLCSELQECSVYCTSLFRLSPHLSYHILIYLEPPNSWQYCQWWMGVMLRLVFE